MTMRRPEPCSCGSMDDMPRRRDYAIVVAPRITERHSRNTGCVRVEHGLQAYDPNRSTAYGQPTPVTFTLLSRGN